MILTTRMDLRILYFNTKPNLWFMIITCILAGMSHKFYDLHLTNLAYPTGIIGTALAFLIGFRNNSAYDRWWEARQIWGKLVNDSRHFGLKTISFLSNEWNPALTDGDLDTARKRLVYRHIAFVWACNKHIRKNPWEETIQPFISGEEFEKLKQAQHIPLTLLKYQVQDIKALYEQKYFEDYRHLSFDEIMENFNDALGKSERIKNTVFPMQYNWYMQYAIWVFLILLPFSLAPHLGNFLFPISCIVGFVFIVLEYLGRHLEKPFENHPNDTPIDALSRTIEINLKELLGEEDLPPKMEPLHGKYLL